MGRGKVQIERVEKPGSQQVTFSKHRSGLFKKAHELSVLCDAEIAVIISSSTGKMHSFASPNSNMKMIQERYYRRKSMESKRNEVHVDSHSGSNNIHVDPTLKSSLNIETLDRENLCNLEQELRKQLSSVQRIKDQRMMEHYEELHMKKCYSLNELVAELQENVVAQKNPHEKIIHPQASLEELCTPNLG